MSNYIGNQPSAGEFKKLDSIASSFNGSLTQFDLDYNTVNQSVGDATQLIVSLNGIIQEPGAAYTLGIGGGSIVFASAPASTDTCHIVLLGGVGGTTTPTDGSVTASKLDASLKDYLEETFTADGTQTVFTLTRAVVGINNLLVTIDGIVQPSSAFTASGTTLTISEVLAANTNVRVVHMGVKAGVYVPANDSVTTDMLANSINTDIASKLPLAGGAMTGVIGNFESTGIDDQAADTVLTILSNGNVGIGTSSPSNKLDIKGTVGFEATNSTNSWLAYTYTDNTFRLNYNGVGADEVVIDSSGNVGIGTTNPSQILEAQTSSTTYVTATTTGTGTSAGHRSTAGTNDWAWFATQGQPNYRLYDYASSAVRLTVTNSGNVGISTTSPSSPLQIQSSNNQIRLVDSQNTSMYCVIETISDAGLSFNADVGGAAASSRIQFNVDNDEKMRIDNDGNIGIDNINPQRQVHIGAADNSNHDAVIVLNNGGATGYRAGIEWRYEGITAPRARLSANASTLELEADINGTKVAAFDGDGLKMTAGKGIKFSAYGSGNILDDYEEGTWTPTGEGITYSAASGSYVKVGRMVMVTYNITFPSTGNTGGAQINSLPFSATAGNAYQSGGYITATSGGGAAETLFLTVATTRLIFRDSGNNNKTNNQFSQDFIQGSAVYMTD